MHISDIAIIGSGVAATTTLIEIFYKLIADPFIGKKIEITVIEKHSEFWKGIPYGSRSSVSSLTISSIPDFLPVDKERALFLTWLKKNKSRWVRYYRKNGGVAAEKWLDKNVHLIEKGEWQKIYLPRFVFGIYLQEKMLNLLRIVEERGLAKLTLIQAEAVDIMVEDPQYRVELEYSDGKTSSVVAKRVVLAIGSAPIKRKVERQNRNYTYINDLYEPSLDDNLEKLKCSLSDKSNIEDRNVLIIGSNASSIELLYLLNHRPDIMDLINKIVTISRSGKMPRCISTKSLSKYPCKNLDQIKERGHYDIHSLIEAAKIDIQVAVQDEVIVPFVDRIIEYTIELVQVLDEDSKKMFFGIYGPQLSRLIRRSGMAYVSSLECLVETKTLQLLKGRFLRIEPGCHGGTLNYVNPNNHVQSYPISFKAIINCSGSDNLEASSSRLIYNLVNKKICKINLSEKGFLVNDKFEAAPNLFIMGPLLGGNMNKVIHFWHLESVSRLQYLSPYLAEILISEQYQFRSSSA